MKARTKLTMLAAGAVAALALGSLGWAAIPGPGGVINGCYDKVSGQMRIHDAETNVPKGCGPKEAALSWNQQGIQGPPGPDGAKGEKGDPGLSEAWAAITNAGPIPPGDTYVTLAGGVKDLPPGAYMISGMANWDALQSGSASLRCNLATTGATGQTLSGFGAASTTAGGSVPMSGHVWVPAGMTGTLSVACKQIGGSVDVWAAGAVQAIRLDKPHFS